MSLERVRAIGRAATWLVFGASVLGACSGASSSLPGSALGRPCVPEDDSASGFSGFAVGEANAYGNEAQCD
jgi:hypothetical protein